METTYNVGRSLSPTETGSFHRNPMSSVARTVIQKSVYLSVVRDDLPGIEIHGEQLFAALEADAL